MSSGKAAQKPGALPGVPAILIVDDETALLGSLAAAVRARGYVAHTASDGLHALEMARGTTYDVLVTDVKMPGLDGPALVDAMQGEGISAAVVVITGHATLDLAIECLRRGAVDFLRKPFDLELFLQSVEKAIGKGGVGSRRRAWRLMQAQYGLSTRQREILESLYYSGKKNRELAADFCVSPETIKSHIRTAYEKLGISNRVGLARLINELGG